jgi:hypothetical protein
MLTAVAERPRAAMPPLDPAPPLSRFEFWPGLLFYLPVWAYVLWLMLRHRSIRAPLASNPALPASGLFGEEKSLVLGLPRGEAAWWFARSTVVQRSGSAADTLVDGRAAMAAAGLRYPLVAKPDLGCRGAGVRPVRTEAELRAYIEAFPGGERIVLQELVDEEGEAGIFWARAPGAARGEIFSLTLKYFPRVTGDGRSTLRQLIEADPRAGKLTHLYFPRHRERLDQILTRGEQVRLAFAGSHSRGAIFRDGARFITPAMVERFDRIADGLPGFHIGRFDIRFASFEDVQDGHGFRIIEVNGAGSEATHIWDSRIRLRDAYRALWDQWRRIFAIGAMNRALGHRPEGYGAFLRRRAHERRATRAYPPTA